MFVATINTPGYLPWDDEPPVFETAREAWQYLVAEVDNWWDGCHEDENGALLDAHTQMHNIDQSQPGVVYTQTPSYEGEHDLGLAYCVTEMEGIYVHSSGADEHLKTATCDANGCYPIHNTQEA